MAIDVGMMTQSGSASMTFETDNSPMINTSRKSHQDGYRSESPTYEWTDFAQIIKNRYFRLRIGRRSGGGCMLTQTLRLCASILDYMKYAQQLESGHSWIISDSSWTEYVTNITDNEKRNLRHSVEL